LKGKVCFLNVLNSDYSAEAQGRTDLHDSIYVI
jgi:hypothetical protein